MDNGSITEYMDKHPQVGCIDLVSGFVPGATTRSKYQISQLRDVANGLYYLHSYGIIHGDLKAVSHSTLSQFSRNQSMIPMNAKANSLIDEDGRARLTDFGLTSIVGENKSDTLPQVLNQVAATTWMTPGILNGGAVTKEVDVFMFAMVAAEVCTGEGGFYGSF